MKTLLTSVLSSYLGAHLTQTHFVREISLVKVINSLKISSLAPREVEAKLCHFYW